MQLLEAYMMSKKYYAGKLVDATEEVFLVFDREANIHKIEVYQALIDDWLPMSFEALPPGFQVTVRDFIEEYLFNDSELLYKESFR